MIAEALTVAACCFGMCGGRKYAAASLFRDYAANICILTNDNATAMLSREEKRENMDNASITRKRLQ